MNMDFWPGETMYWRLHDVQCMCTHACSYMTQQTLSIHDLNYTFASETFLSNLQLISTSRPFMMKLNYQYSSIGILHKCRKENQDQDTHASNGHYSFADILYRIQINLCARGKERKSRIGGRYNVAQFEKSRFFPSGRHNSNRLDNIVFWSTQNQ